MLINNLFARLYGNLYNLINNTTVGVLDTAFPWFTSVDFW